MSKTNFAIRKTEKTPKGCPVTREICVLKTENPANFACRKLLLAETVKMKDYEYFFLKIESSEDQYKHSFSSE